MGENDKRARLEVFGKVQGVFFRASTRDKAREFGVVGWVRNRSDGAVEAVVEGPKEAVDKLIKWAEVGPPRAQVDRIEVSEEEMEGGFEGFEVKR